MQRRNSGLFILPESDAASVNLDTHRAGIDTFHDRQR